MEHQFRCRTCSRDFKQKSSLTRHSKKCTLGPVPSLRQKSCRQCKRSKTKCDLHQPKCTRCAQRGASCEYFVPMITRKAGESSLPEASEDASMVRDGLPAMEPDAQITLASSVEQLDLLRANPEFSSSVALTDLTVSNSPYFGATMTRLHQDEARMPSFSHTLLENVDAALSASLMQHSLESPAVSLTNIGPMRTTIDTNFNHGNSHYDNFFLWNPGPSSRTPLLVKHSMETLLRVMKTWPRMLARGLQTPPMMHSTHTLLANARKPILNCVALAKMWASQSENSSEVVRQAILQEMCSLFQNWSQHGTTDELDILSALQALVIYVIMIIFPEKNQHAVCIVDPAVFLCLQRVVASIAGTGLMATEEMEGTRPTWEVWIHIVAKRRAVFCLYLLHWSYSVYHDLQSFACSDLGFIPAPEPKYLWHAETEGKWQTLYDEWLAQWGNRPYILREFSAVQAGASLDERTEAWLEETDELGIMFFSIVNATDRGEPRFEYGTGISITDLE